MISPLLCVIPCFKLDFFPSNDRQVYLAMHFQLLPLILEICLVDVYFVVNYNRRTLISGTAKIMSDFSGLKYPRMVSPKDTWVVFLYPVINLWTCPPTTSTLVSKTSSFGSYTTYYTYCALNNSVSTLPRGEKILCRGNLISATSFQKCNMSVAKLCSVHASTSVGANITISFINMSRYEVSWLVT